MPRTKAHFPRLTATVVQSWWSAHGATACSFWSAFRRAVAVVIEGAPVFSQSRRVGRSPAASSRFPERQQRSGMQQGPRIRRLTDCGPGTLGICVKGTRTHVSFSRGRFACAGRGDATRARRDAPYTVAIDPVLHTGCAPASGTRSSGCDIYRRPASTK